MVKKIYNLDYIQKLTDVCEMMYTDVCDIYSDIEVTDENTHLTYKETTLVHEQVRCRVSHKSGSGSYLKGNTVFSETIADSSKNVKIFLSYNLDIKIGDTLVITKRGYINKYLVSTIPNIFSSHQEFYCELVS